MQWHEFVFSNQPAHRNRRHLACWFLWWVYLVFTIFFTPINTRPNTGLNHHQPGLLELGYLSYSLLVILKSVLLLLTHLFFCYATIYFLLPKYLSRKKYWQFIAGVVILCTLLIPAGYFLYSIVYPFVDKLFGLYVVKSKIIVYVSIDAGLVNAIKVTVVMAAITLLKRWWLKQKEKEKLEKEKINAELQLLKAQIHPAFLFSTLNNITSHARAASPQAPEMLIKLSDLLSYMLYECDVPKVRLEKEISMVKEYITLEKIRHGDKMELTFQVNGNINGQMISPLLLLPFIENSFSYCSHELVEQAWVNLDITIDNASLSMKIINGIPALIATDASANSESLNNVQKRLHLLYPGRHEVKINAEHELLMVYLNLNLEETSGEQPAVIEITKPFFSHA